jgi:hypothetical protein
MPTAIKPGSSPWGLWFLISAAYLSSRMVAGWKDDKISAAVHLPAPPYLSKSRPRLSYCLEFVHESYSRKLKFLRALKSFAKTVYPLANPAPFLDKGCGHWCWRKDHRSRRESSHLETVSRQNQILSGTISHVSASGVEERHSL